jgi:hypothetical protein
MIITFGKIDAFCGGWKSGKVNIFSERRVEISSIARCNGLLVVKIG